MMFWVRSIRPVIFQVDRSGLSGVLGGSVGFGEVGGAQPARIRFHPKVRVRVEGTYSRIPR